MPVDLVFWSEISTLKYSLVSVRQFSILEVTSPRIYFQHSILSTDSLKNAIFLTQNRRNTWLFWYGFENYAKNTQAIRKISYCEKKKKQKQTYIFYAHFESFSHYSCAKKIRIVQKNKLRAGHKLFTILFPAPPNIPNKLIWVESTTCTQYLLSWEHVLTVLKFAYFLCIS